MMPGDPSSLGLPHRDPFVFIDRVRDIEPGESACCEKCFSPDTDFFRGHFPGQPIVPGVILTEALAQTAGIAAGKPGRSFRLSAIRSMKFPSAVQPGELITLLARMRGVAGQLWQFEVVAKVADRVVAEGAIVLNEA